VSTPVLRRVLTPVFFSSDSLLTSGDKQMLQHKMNWFTP